MSKKAIARRCRNQKFIFAPAPPLLIIQEIFFPIFVFLCLLFTFIFILFCTLCWLPKKIFYLEHCFTPFLLIAQKCILSLRQKTGRVKTRKEFCKIAFDGAKGDRGNNFCNQAKVKGTISSSPGLGTNFNFWLVWRNITSDIAILKDIW